MAEQTYRTKNAYVSVAALTRLVQLARVSESEFSFGPTELASIAQQGLTVTADDLTEVKSVLAAIPGMVEVDA